MVIGKKGAAHFEMIISFVFFVGFVLFLFFFLKPYDTTVLSGSAVAALYDTFEEQVHTNLTSIFLKADNDVPATCFRIELPGEIFSYALTESYVTDLAGNVRSSNLEDTAPGADLNINADDGFYRVYISPEFSAGSLAGCELATNPYVVGSKIERRVISYSALEAMEQRYSTDYNGLKADLKVPDVFEFFMESEDLPDIVLKDFIPSSIENIETHDYLFEVLKDDGSLINARITIGIW